MFENNGIIPVIDATFLSGVTYQGNSVTCNEVKNTNNYGVILKECTVATNPNLYCFAKGKVYSCDDLEFINIYNNTNGNSNLSTYGSSIVSSTSNKNVYSKGSSDTQELNYMANVNMYGDAIYETSSTYTGKLSWNSDFSYIPSSSDLWFVRGGSCSNTTGAGSFNFGFNYGGVNVNNSFRAVIDPLQ